MDRYLGHVHEDMSVLLRDALACFEAVVAAGDLRIETDPDERGAVPTIRSSRLPGGPTFSVDAYGLGDDARRRDVSIHVSPGEIGTDIATPRCSLRIIVEDVEDLVPRDADEIATARIVLRTAAHHLDEALEVARRIGVPSEDRGPRYDIPPPAAADLREMRIEGLIGVEQPSGTPRLRMHTPMPWCGTVVRDVDARRSIEPMANRMGAMPTILQIRTAFSFTDQMGRGTGASVKLSSFAFVVQALEPMERLRILADRTGRKG